MDYITTDWAIYKITKIDDYFIIMKNCRWNNKCPTYDFDELVVDRISGRMSRKWGKLYQGYGIVNQYQDSRLPVNV